MAEMYSLHQVLPDFRWGQNIDDAIYTEVNDTEIYIHTSPTMSADT